MGYIKPEDVFAIGQARRQQGHAKVCAIAFCKPTKMAHRPSDPGRLEGDWTEEKNQRLCEKLGGADGRIYLKEFSKGMAALAPSDAKKFMQFLSTCSAVAADFRNKWEVQRQREMEVRERKQRMYSVKRESLQRALMVRPISQHQQAEMKKLHAVAASQIRQWRLNVVTQLLNQTRVQLSAELDRQIGLAEAAEEFHAHTMRKEGADLVSLSLVRAPDP